MTIEPTPFLRGVLAADGAFCLVAGTVLALGATSIEPLTGLPEGFSVAVGVLLIVWGAAVAWLSSRRPMPTWAVKGVIALNAIWVVDSLILPLTGWLPLTALGTTLILAQAAAGAAIAVLQALALSRAAPATRLATV